MSSSAKRRTPISDRFRRASTIAAEAAADLAGSATWVVVRSDGDDLVVIASAGLVVLEEGGTVRIEPSRDLMLPLASTGERFWALCGLGAAPVAGDPVTAGRVQRLADLLGTLASAEWDAEEQTARADSESKRAHRVEMESLTDALTGVSNRRAWDRALATEERRRRRYGGAAAVVVADLDNLKEVNDNQGHLHGDLLLREMARIISETSRDSDLVARTGGDEFAVLALNCEEPQLRVLLSRMRRALDDGSVSASVGGACRRPNSTMTETWAEADEVMFSEKEKRKG